MGIYYNRRRMGATPDQMLEFYRRIKELGLLYGFDKKNHPEGYDGPFYHVFGSVEEEISVSRLDRSDDPDLEKKIDALAVEIFGPKDIICYFDKKIVRYHGVDISFEELEAHEMNVSHLELLHHAFSAWIDTVIKDIPDECQKCFGYEPTIFIEWGWIHPKWWKPRIDQSSAINDLVEKGMFEVSYLKTTVGITKKGLNFFLDMGLLKVLELEYNSQQLKETIDILKERVYEE